MTESDRPHASHLDRRRLFSGGAAIAGATAVGLALSSPTADAADGDPVVLGTENEAGSTTAITVAPGSSPTLRLANADGPSLFLEPVADSWNGDLPLGAIANTSIGPLVGVDLGNGPETVQLATTRDVEGLPETFAIRPVRLIDTRWTGDFLALVQSSSSAFDSKRRLRAGAWMDIAVAPAHEGYLYSAAHINLTVIDTSKRGYLTAYAPGELPRTSNLQFAPGRDVDNSAFVGLDIVEDFYALRVHTTATTHLIIDITGVMVSVDTARTSGLRTAGKVQARQRRQAKMSAAIRRSLAMNGAR